MSFSSFNQVQAAKGLAGTSRQANATFSGLSGRLQGPPQGLQGPSGQVAQQAPQGSSYSLSGGMQQTGRNMTGRNMNTTPNRYANMPDASGVIAGQPGKMADVGQVGPGLTSAQMQDPENAALAGFQFAQGQDAPVQASPGVNMGQQLGQQTPTLTPQVPISGPTTHSAMGKGALQPLTTQAPKAPQYRTM